jgi:ferredoxin
MDVAQAILAGLGYAGTHFSLIACTQAGELDAQLKALSQRRGATPAQPARFAVPQDKRSTLELAIDHLAAQGSPAADSIALPQGAPFGTLAVDAAKCTLCLSCVSACPASALQDNPQAPQLRFVEQNCVQCGLCAVTCPEQAITLTPRLSLSPERKQPRVLNESRPYGCVRCGKPFGTLKAIEAMLSRLSGHAMFQGAAAERLKMCGDCRVVDIYTASDEVRITDR